MGKKFLLKKGFVHVYTGNGKGKTTAALGLAIRAAGAGLRVIIVQFLKGEECSEFRSLRKMGKSITLKQFGSGCFVTKKPSSRDIAIAAKGLKISQKAVLCGKYDLVILDEVCCAISLNMIEIQSIMMLLKQRPYYVEIVLTGRDAPKEILEMADLVTEMKKVRHYYDFGVRARMGIEY
jgi:cob(I)alamin adenosyltransferase